MNKTLLLTLFILPFVCFNQTYVESGTGTISSFTYKTPISGSASDSYSTTESIYLPSEFNGNPLGIHNSIGYYTSSGDYNASGSNMKIYLKTTTATTVGSTASLTGYTLVYDGSATVLTSGTFGWRQINFNQNGNIFSWLNDNLSVLVVHSRGGNSASLNNYVHSSSTTASSSRYVGNTSWTSGTSTMTQNQKPRIRLARISALSITLSSFTAQRRNEVVQLNWTTESETNNDFFTVFHSTDGFKWSEIGRVNGVGNSKSTKSYELNHLNTRKSDNYYKVRQTDFNGQFEEFDPIVLRDADDIQIHPNPAVDFINISQEIPFEVFDVRGTLIHLKHIDNITYDIKDLQPGIYLIHFATGEILRFIKH
jgi:hypothetical protein